MLTSQEIFDKVWQHFIVERRPQSANHDTGECLYRTETGAKCAVGVLIPDILYHPDMEGLGVDKLVCKFPDVAALFPGVPEKFLAVLQLAHDAPSQSISYSLREFARKYDLVVPQSPAGSL